MLKHLVIGLGALALTVAMIDRNAFANGTFAVILADYNSAQVAENDYVVTVPEYTTINGIFYNSAYTLTAGTKLEAGSLLTLTLPAGFTFNTVPSLCFFQFDDYDVNLISGGVGSQSLTFQIVTAVTDTAYTVIVYPSFKINTPTSFASSYGGNSLALSIQATGNATAANNDPNPVSQPAFQHAVGSLPDTITPGGGQITLANPYYGDQFVAGGSDGNTIMDSGSVATFAIVTETTDPFNQIVYDGNSVDVPVLSPNGALNTLDPSDTANITVEGYFNGIGLAYADTTAGACQDAIPSGTGMYTGTVTNRSISFSGIPINTPVQICIIPFGVMWANNLPYVYTYSAGAGVTDYFGGLAQTTAGNFYTYEAAPTTVLEVLAGSPQSTTVNSGFCTPLGVKVYDTSTTPAYPLKGIDVIFTAPSSGQSGNFADGVDCDLGRHQFQRCRRHRHSSQIRLPASIRLRLTLGHSKGSLGSPMTRE